LFHNPTVENEYQHVRNMLSESYSDPTVNECAVAMLRKTGVITLFACNKFVGFRMACYSYICKEQR